MRSEFEKVKRLFFELRAIYHEPTVRLLPAHLAFFAVLSLMPIMAIIFFGVQFLSLDVEHIIGPLRLMLPQAVSDVLMPTEEKASGLSVGIWLIIALFVGSNGVNSVIVGSNALYGFTSTNYIFRRAKALLLTFLLVILILAGVAIVSLGNYLLGIVPDGLPRTIGILRWVLVILLMFATVKYLYMVTPRKRILSRYTNLGSAFTVIGCGIATLAYTFYYTNFSNYDWYYGNLTTIIVLMIWVYIMATVFVSGMIINVCQFRKDAAKPGVGTDAPLVADTEDAVGRQRAQAESAD